MLFHCYLIFRRDVFFFFALFVLLFCDNALEYVSLLLIASSIFFRFFHFVLFFIFCTDEHSLYRSTVLSKKLAPLKQEAGQRGWGGVGETLLSKTRTAGGMHLSGL